MHRLCVLVVVEEVVDGRPKSMSGEIVGKDEIGNFIRDGGQDPPLNEGIKLIPFSVVSGRSDGGAVDESLEVESENQESKQSTPFFVIWLGKTKLHGDMEFNI